jgi:cytochrome c oxidase assembly protein subunit 15
VAEAILANGHSSAPPRDASSVPLAVRRWLVLVWALVFCMVVLGGTTRLTGSGLSIVEWKPLSGAIPPLTQADWQELWAKYQHSPQYRDVNQWMTLADFKRIFFWEYVHRLVGRAIGAVVLVPWLYFVVRKRLPRALALQTLGLFVLGGLQGLLGWYMVASGLIDEPRVSHFRLAAHLLLAFATGQFVLWLALDAYFPRQPARALPRARLLPVFGALALLAVQVCYGAFMAGTHAGYYYPTFPDMNGHYAPAPFFTGNSVVQDALTNPMAIHYLHRLFGWMLLCGAIAIWVFAWRVRARRAVTRAAAAMAALTFVQFNLGALTVLRRVDVPWAAAHQAVAYLLVSSAVFLLHRALGSDRNALASQRSAASGSAGDHPPQQALSE